jgi:hypothetical protein
LHKRDVLKPCAICGSKKGVGIHFFEAFSREKCPQDRTKMMIQVPLCRRHHVSAHLGRLAPGEASVLMKRAQKKMIKEVRRINHVLNKRRDKKK